MLVVHHGPEDGGGGSQDDLVAGNLVAIEDQGEIWILHICEDILPHIELFGILRGLLVKDHLNCEDKIFVPVLIDTLIMSEEIRASI